MLFSLFWYLRVRPAYEQLKAILPLGQMILMPKLIMLGWDWHNSIYQSYLLCQSHPNIVNFGIKIICPNCNIPFMFICLPYPQIWDKAKEQTLKLICQRQRKKVFKFDIKMTKLLKTFGNKECSELDRKQSNKKITNIK